MSRPSRALSVPAFALPAILALVVPGRPVLAAPPVIQCPGPIQSHETATVLFTLQVSDPDGDPVTVRCLNPPSRASYDDESRQFYWTSGYDQAGQYAVRFEAGDGTATDTCTVAITIANLNRGPLLYCPSNVSGKEGETTSLQLEASDPDHDPIRFSSPNLPAGATLTSGGRFTWLPRADQAGTRAVTFVVSDGTIPVSCNTSFDIADTPGLPLMSAPAGKTTYERFETRFSVTATIPGMYLPVVAENLPAGATYDGLTGTFIWTPATGQAGRYDLAFHATNAGLTSRAVVTLNVLDSPPGPAIQCPGARQGFELEPITFQVTATDPLGQPVTLSAAGLPSGAAFQPATGWFSWTPGAGQSGDYVVTFEARTSTGLSGCSVPLHVLDRQLGIPLIQCPGASTVAAYHIVSFTVFATDPNGAMLTGTLENPPAGAQFDPRTLVFTWRPVAGQEGVQDLRFRIANADTAARCTTQVTVTPFTPGTPTAYCPGSPVEALLGTRIVLYFSAFDPDHLPVDLAAQNLPEGATFVPAEGRLDWTPAEWQAGDYDVRVIASNGFAADSCGVRIEVAGHAQPPDSYTPVIFRLSDLPQDQGGWLRLRIFAAGADYPGGANPPVTGYSIWRRVEPGALRMPPPGGDAGEPRGGAAAPAAGLPTGTWESVGYVPAVRLPLYLVAVPTRADSGSGGPPREVYVVGAHTAGAGSFSYSDPDSAYSVDNLAPAAPAGAGARAAPDGIRLAWSRGGEPDLDHYEVYRAAGGAGPPLDAGHRIAVTRDTTATDTAPVPDGTYAVVAVDLHGNPSPPTRIDAAGLPAAGPTGALWLAPPEPNPTRGAALLRFSLGRDGPVRLRILDLRGRQVRGLVAAPLAAGSHFASWDGRDDRGARAPAGLYLVEVATGPDSRVGKLVLVP